MKSIVIDNFFEDPYSVIDFANKQTYYARQGEQYYEGKRTPNILDIDEKFFSEVSTKIIYHYFDQTKTYAIQGNLNFHKSSTSDMEDPNWLSGPIHKDDGFITSCIVYLTPDAPMDSGTQIYREVDNEFVPDITYYNKFNRMIMFPGEVPHAAMSLSGGDKERLTMLFFLRQIDEV